MKRKSSGYREREKERETARGRQEDGRRQSSALSSLSAELDESVLTAQERLRQHLPTHLHTQTHTSIGDEQRREEANEGVSECNVSLRRS